MFGNLQRFQCRLDGGDCCSDDLFIMQNGNESRLELRWREIDAILQHLLEELPETDFVCYFDRVPIDRLGLAEEGGPHRSDPRLLDRDPGFFRRRFDSRIQLAAVSFHLLPYLFLLD